MPEAASNRPQRRGVAKSSDLVVQPRDVVASSARRMPRTVIAAPPPPPPPFPQQQQKQLQKPQQHLSRQPQRCMVLSTSGEDDLRDQQQHLATMRWSNKEPAATGPCRSQRACGSTARRGAELQHHQAAAAAHPHQQQIPSHLAAQAVQQDRSEARYHASLQSSQSQLHHQQKQQQLQRAERGIRPCDTVAAGDMEMPDDSDEFDDLVAPARDDCSQPMSSGQRQQQTQPEYLDYDDDEANSADGDGIWEEAEENDEDDEDDFDEDGADDDEEEGVSDDVTDSAGNGNYSQQLYQQQQLMQQKQLYQQQQQQVLRGSCHGVDCRGDEGLTAAMHHRPATSNKLADVMTRRMGQQQQQQLQQMQQMQQQQAKKHMQQHQPRLAQFDQRARVHSSPTAGNRTVDPREGKLTMRQRKQQQQVIQERQPQPQQQSQQLPPSPPPLLPSQQQQPRQAHHVMMASQAPQQQRACHTSNSSNDYQQRITCRLILEMVSCGRCNICRLASSSHGTSLSVTDASGMKQQPGVQVIRIAQPGCCSQQALPGTAAHGDTVNAAATMAAASAATATATSRRTRRCLNQQLQPE